MGKVESIPFRLSTISRSFFSENADSFYTLYLSKFKVYFDIGVSIDEKSMCPILVFTCKKTGEVYSYLIPTEQIQDRKGDRLDKMLTELIIMTRDKKLGEFDL